LFQIHNASTFTVDKFAAPEHRNVWAPKLCKMEMMGSFCLTEPGFLHSVRFPELIMVAVGSGSDAQSLKTKAEFDERSQEYIINGEKAFISGAGKAIP
jgi:alkylation response protein AidB-like acyl-CoA dehydrogenase